MQTALDLTVMLPQSAYDYGERSSGEAHGVVLTKPHVVNLILDLAGYTADRDLASLSLLDPACGHGAFLVPAAERLIQSARRHDRDLLQIESAIRSYDIARDHVDRSRLAVAGALARLGLPHGDAQRLSEAWIAHGDFLLTSQGRRFDAVVGNPPYIRIEQLSPELQEEYRDRYRSLYDRADLYVAFIERGLDLLAPGGVLSFICADRWTLNRYGAPLRRMLSRWFRVRCYIDLRSASPFESDVVAYPSIFAVSPGKTGSVPVATLRTASPEEYEAASAALRGAPERGAGVAVTGSDRIYIIVVGGDDVDIERDRPRSGCAAATCASSAQYLRRICPPPPESVAEELFSDLRSSFRQRDFHRLDALALRAYGIDALPGFSLVDTRR